MFSKWLTTPSLSARLTDFASNTGITKNYADSSDGIAMSVVSKTSQFWHPSYMKKFMKKKKGDYEDVTNVNTETCICPHAPDPAFQVRADTSPEPVRR